MPEGLRAELPDGNYRTKRMTIEFIHFDNKGDFIMRTLSLYGNEYRALEKAFYKKFKEESKS